MAIIIGSRDSELAMIQTNHVKQSLEVKFPHLKFEIVSMKTIGDKNLEQPLKDVGKSLFTKELETLLLANQCDFVVHSLKDMPTSLPAGLVLGAILEREDPSDVIISKHGNIETLAPGSIVGTSSVRRIAQLKRVFPHLVYKDIRGNLNTRLQKLEDPSSPYSCIVLASAGVVRMGWKNRITQVLNTEQFPYAVGQGAIGIECRQGDDKILAMLKELEHEQTTLKCMAERSFMKKLEGGCSVPLGVTTQIGAKLTLTGHVSSPDGTEHLSHTDEIDLNGSLVDKIAAAQALGDEVANSLISLGAADILALSRPK